MEDSRTLLVHHILAASRANGPGLRAVVWTQGCTLGCPDCFNPETHAFTSGNRIAVIDLAAQLVALAPGIQGITLSGGEPLQQAPALAELLQRVRRSSSLSVIVFTGYSLKEITLQPFAQTCLEYIDVLIAGRYEAHHRLAVGLRGSSNKMIHFLTSRYQQADFDMVPEAEIIIGTDGTIDRSGIRPLGWPLRKGSKSVV